MAKPTKTLERSEQAVKRYVELLEAKRHVIPDAGLQLRIEEVYLAKLAAQGTRASYGRIQELDQSLKSFTSERDSAAAQGKDELDKAADEVCTLHAPFIEHFRQWADAAMAVAEDHAFSEYLFSGIRSIDSLKFHPLAELVAAAERCQQRVKSWKFESDRQRSLLPALDMELLG